MKLLMIDNYDSFTYNLVQYFGELGAQVEVFRNDEITVEGIAAAPARPAGGLARPLLAGRGRHLGRGDPALRRQAADPGRVPGPPGHRRGVRRQDRAGAAAHARQDQRDHDHAARACSPACPRSSPSTATTRWRSSERPARPSWRPRPGPTTARSWACATSSWPIAGRAVPPRIDPDRAWPRHAEELPGADDERADRRWTCAATPSRGRPPACARRWRRRRWATTCSATTPASTRCRRRSPALLGFEAALFVPTGTQSNLCAILSHCQRGDEYIVGQMQHCYRWEGGGAAVFGSVQPQPLEHQPDGTPGAGRHRGGDQAGRSAFRAHPAAGAGEHAGRQAAAVRLRRAGHRAGAAQGPGAPSGRRAPVQCRGGAGGASRRRRARRGAAHRAAASTASRCASARGWARRWARRCAARAS